MQGQCILSVHLYYIVTYLRFFYGVIFTVLSGVSPPVHPVRGYEEAKEVREKKKN